MCGIIGCLSNGDAAATGLSGLRRLEYRGYDSAGIAVIDRGRLSVVKERGRIDELENKHKISQMRGSIAILHTRWATHGAPSSVNAHPHTDCKGKLALVHNGIIENHSLLRKILEGEGHCFRSETDSEVIAHLIEKFRAGCSLRDAVRKATALLEGAYAICVVDEGEECIVAARRGSPLVIGIGDGRMFVASDPSAFVGQARKMVYLDDNDVADVRIDSYSITDSKNNRVDKAVESLTLTLEQMEKGGFKHFMLKEIFEQPEALRNVLRGRLSGNSVKISVGDLSGVKRVVVVACGTAWHAGLIGKSLLESIARVPTEVDYASEFRYRDPLVGAGDLVVAVSQSGETADTLAALREAKRKGAKTLGVVNVVGSSIAREVGGGIYLHAGPEIGVASTKAFTAQITALCLLAIHMRQQRGGAVDESLIGDIGKLPELVSAALETDRQIEPIAKEFSGVKDFLYLGRGINYPIALEGALKLKEISYIHAEGYPAAEMKHGPIALIDKDMPVVFIATENGHLDKVMSNMEEVKARGGRIIAIANEPVNENLRRLAERIVCVPKARPELSPVVNAIPLQLLAYHIADMKGIDVDKPRNLAKSVTVE
jgi:glucosamine--fructose-6-phosphate aminotransferase (isomerizing)